AEPMLVERTRSSESYVNNAFIHYSFAHPSTLDSEALLRILAYTEANFLYVTTTYDTLNDDENPSVFKINLVKHKTPGCGEDTEWIARRIKAATYCRALAFETRFVSYFSTFTGIGEERRSHPPHVAESFGTLYKKGYGPSERLNRSICATTSFLVRKLHTALLHWQTYFGCVCATLSGWCNVFGRKIGDKINNNKSCSRDGRSGTDSSGGTDNDKITVGERELSRREKYVARVVLHCSCPVSTTAWFTPVVLGTGSAAIRLPIPQTRLVSYRELTRNLHATRPRRLAID
ncbi:hypothetical protein J6590_108000, partial [Homalodisca vitripennis]